MLDQRRRNLVQARLTETGLYHSFRLPDGSVLRGSMALEWQLERLDAFRLPSDLTGKRVLDIGPWDGFYTFEMERRGAEVVAIDYVDLDTFRVLHRAFSSKARYERMDVYEINSDALGQFDIVLCLGVLYHLKHPLLALEKICSVTRDVCIIDTFTVEPVASNIPCIEFYERDELGGQLDNWIGPTVSAVQALARAAGFARAEVLRVTEETGCVGAHRRWPILNSADGVQTELLGLKSHLDCGRSFRSCKEEYIELWCAWAGTDAPSLDEVFPEVDGYGVPPLFCHLKPQGLLVNIRVPYGLTPGKHSARIRIGRGRLSAPLDFYVDLPPITNTPTITAVQDGVLWTNGEVDWAQGGWATVWCEGLTPEADPGNTVVDIGGIPHTPEAVDSAGNQVNVRLRPVVGRGERDVCVHHRGGTSNAVRVRITGTPPAIHGLERIMGGPS